MSSDDVALRIRHISKRFEIYDKPRHRLQQMLFGRWKTYYREFWALRDIDLEVKKGECVGIIGRNGAGKSTLLQIVTGTLQPMEGTVERHGRIAALLELGSGFNPEFTGSENVYMNAAILGLTKAETDAKYDDIVAFADIGEFIDQPVKTYSSGMMVRLAFAVNAFVDPDILIVDEALAVGDAVFQQKCMRFIRKFKEEHTILFVSHDTAAVVNLCDRAVLLDGGRIFRIGPAKDVTEYYLSRQFQALQKGGTIEEKGAQGIPKATPEEDVCFKDMRHDFIVTTNLRNDIELLRFNDASGAFGTGAAKITDVVLTDESGDKLSWCVGGEMVKLRISAEAYRDLYRPIIGFIVKDHLGQGLFAANTCVAYLQNPLSVSAGQALVAEFEFRMPILYRGDYSIMVSIAEGTQQENVQHHWIHDAFIFRSHAPEPLALLGIPMKNIKMKVC
ncbi:MAG: ABC transporter ATP-binding protein [Lentisphaeria bacterium]|nr:ABC transporter ATP-binding protein [Lentisphaeria bacterium]